MHHSLLLVFCVAAVHAAQFTLIDFDDTVLAPLTQIPRRHAMYTNVSSPSTATSWSGNEYASRVTMNVGFRVEPTEYTMQTGPFPLELALFHQDELENAKQAQLDGTFCCTTKTDKGYGCEIKGEDGTEPTFIKTYTPVFKTQVWVPGDGNTTVALHRADIHKTGMHFLTYSSCWKDNVDILLTGHNEWLNPYGYVPGELYYNIPFFLAMTVLYALATIVWAALIIWYRNDGILKVQWGIGLLILLGLAECFMWWSEYNIYNQMNARSTFLLTAAACISALKKTLGRLVMLAISMGYGICRPHLGANAIKLAAFGLVYCACTIIQEGARIVDSENSLSVPYFMLVVGGALLDTFCFYWVFDSLYDVISELEQSKQKRKLRIFKKLLVVIAVCLGCSFGWMGFQIWFLYSDLVLTIWQFTWMLEAYWYVLNFVLLVTVMVLWKPTEHSMRCAFSLELTANDDCDDDGIEMDTSLGDMIAPEEKDVEADGALPNDI